MSAPKFDPVYHRPPTPGFAGVSALLLPGRHLQRTDPPCDAPKRSPGQQVFTNPLPPALWPVLAATAVVRAAAGWATAGHVLRDPLTRRLWWLTPLQDVASFLVWMAGFFGNTFVWRGRKYHLLRDGRFELMQ